MTARGRGARRDGEHWQARGRQHLAHGHIADALQCFERAVEEAPTHAEHWAQLARLQAFVQRHDAAEVNLRRAIALAPGVVGYHLLLARTMREQNAPEQALEALSRAQALDPDNLSAAVASALMLPPVYRDRAELLRWRDRYSRGMRGLAAQVSRWRGRAAEVLQLQWNNFYLAYQGGDDCELQSAYSDFVAELLGLAFPHLQSPVTSSPREDGRIAVAFVSSNFRACTIGDYFLSWVTDLPRDRFVVSVLTTSPVFDAKTAEFERAADHFATIDDDLEAAIALRRGGYDAVVYPDAGMSRRSTVLANLRLAPVQFAAWGHPVTTGSAYVDCYLSCETMEPPDGARHYREPLALLPGIGVRYGAPETTLSERERLGLGRDDHVYVCPQSAYKVHPDTDELLLTVLARDPRAVLLLWSGDTRGQTQALLARLTTGLERLGIGRRQQIKVVPLLPRANFRGVLSLADVMLDTLHWSGGNTSLDALSAGLPIVTLPGTQMRGRQSMAMLRILGLEELVARDKDDYVRIALRVAVDGPYRSELSRRIADGLGLLCDRSEPVQGLAEIIAERVGKFRGCG